jgi:hypothetical protein
MKNNRVAATAFVLCAVLFGALPKSLGGQGGHRQADHLSLSKLSNYEDEIGARKAALLKESLDLESFKGGEFTDAMQIDQKAQSAEGELDATLWFLDIYSRMQCDADRGVARGALKNRLGLYTYLLGIEAADTASDLEFTKSPAVAQLGGRVEKDLRAAKTKLDEIAASLN